MRFRIRNGFDIPLDGAPESTAAAIVRTRRVALVGTDYADLRPSLAVEKGDRVRAGETVFSGRRHPDIHVTAPASGVVRDIYWRRRHRLKSVVIDVNDDPPIEFECFGATDLSELPARVVRERLLESGLWVALRARPYEFIPAPDIEPRAIFLTAIDPTPLAPDPFTQISAQANDFSNGITVISRLTRGNTYVCTASEQKIDLPEIQNVTQVEFDGPHPAGLPGTHIHALEKVSAIPDLWHIGYQDVIAIGQLFTRGIASQQRVIGVCGPGARSPRLLRVPVGAELAELLRDECKPDCRMISGSVLSGHQAPGFLGRYHNQVTLLPYEARKAVRLANIARMIWRGNTGLDRAASCAMHGFPGGMLPLEEFERVWPYRMAPAALLRSLLSGDTERAIELGCLGLAEEDLALCTYICVAKHDYAQALRRTLHDIEQLG
jgi:Na+-transporting NADH:ubiquinone oxidoreductase subunit A